ncbi:hypothetical protein BSZ22_19815 [Bradyrhizobium canariense]|nr:hypothetical protein BSZ22_19815 [Bradyrhizobium canariense]
MRTIEIHAEIRNLNSLSLPDWRVAVVQPAALSRAGRFVSRRYRLEPHVAETVAYLAGLGEQEVRR